METYDGTATCHGRGARMIRYLLVGLFVILPLSAKETFLKKHIVTYLNKHNPYFYKAIGEIYVKKAEEKFASSVLDTNMKLEYDDKNYALTEGTYQYADISKVLLNDVELSLSYRDAQGTQELNNIKTGRAGEMLAGVKIPVFSLINNISQNKTTIDLAAISTDYEKETSRAAINTLYLKIFKAYYQIILYEALFVTEKELLAKAKKNKRLIERQIEVGMLPTIALVEAETLEIERKQRLIYAQNRFLNNKNILLQYLGITNKKFNKRYTLPSLRHKLPRIPFLSSSIRIAMENRPELKQIAYKEKEIALKKEFNTLEKYPRLNVGLYANQDLRHDEGYKVTFDFSLPIERTAYEGRDEALQNNRLVLDSQKSTLMIEIKTKIKNIILKMKMIKEAISLSSHELKLAKKVELAEIKKLKEGVSNLLFVNQREMRTLYTKQKLFKYHYELFLLSITLDFELGLYPEDVPT